MDNHNVYIPVIYDEEVEVNMVKEVCAGLEEEGVPFRRVQAESADKITSSPLQVKIIMRRSCLMIFHEKIPEDEPYIKTESGEERLIGKNAARIVKGLPLIFQKQAGV
jgi:hypothetical protein